MLKKVQIFKALDIEIKKQKGPVATKDGYRGHHSLKEELSQPGITVIGEVAGGNPLRGQVREQYRASTHGKSLVENGARALSIATDRFLYFGEDKCLSDARSQLKVPLIRRDFIFEEYQIEESKILGADAVFLFVALLEQDRLDALTKLALSKNLDVVMEVTNETEIERALEAGGDIICVVGRDLDTWEPSWEKAMALLAKVPERRCLRMIEAGVQTLEQVRHLESLGVHAVIIGDALLDEFYPGKRLAQILSGAEPARKPVRAKSKPAQELEGDAEIDQDSTAISSSPSSQAARKGKKENLMAHVQLPDETTGQVDTPAAEPAAKKPAVKKAAAKKPAEKKPAVKKAVAEKKPAVKKAAEKKPAVKKAAAEKKPAVKKAAEKKPAVKKAAAPKPAAKKVAEKKPAVKKAAAPKPAAKKVAAKPVAKKAAAKPVVKKAAAPKKAAAAPKKAVAKPVAKKAVAKPVAKKAAAPKKTAAKPVAKKVVAPKKAAAAPKKAVAKPVAKKAVAPKKAAAAPKKAAAKPVAKKAVAPKKAAKK